MVKVVLNKVLENKQISLYKLSKDSGVEYSTLHRILNNKTKSISFKMLDKLCKVLKCSFNDLFEFKEDKTESAH